MGTLELLPDVAVLDIAMPLLNGIEATRKLRDVAPSAKVVLLTMHGDALYVADAVRGEDLGGPGQEPVETKGDPVRPGRDAQERAVLELRIGHVEDDRFARDLGAENQRIEVGAVRPHDRAGLSVCAHVREDATRLLGAEPPWTARQRLTVVQERVHL